MPETGKQSDYLEQARYLCRVIDDGHFSLELNWPSVIDTMSFALDVEKGYLVETLRKANVGLPEDTTGAFLVAGVFDADIPAVEKEKIFSRILTLVEPHREFSNILMLISTEYDFTLAVMEFLFRVQGHHLDVFRDSTILPLITSDLFIESKSCNSFVKKHISGMQVDLGRIRKLVRNDWFMDLMTILKSGVRVNQTRGFLKLIDREAHSINAEEMSTLISDGTLAMIVLNRNMILKQDFVTAAFLKRYEAEQHEKKLRRFYYWLGIANDLVLGVLFLIGSFEFLPGMPPGSLFIGVILFIIGSSQLVARSLIQIAMNIHIRSSRNRKMRELPS